MDVRSEGAETKTMHRLGLRTGALEKSFGVQGTVLKRAGNIAFDSARWRTLWALRRLEGVTRRPAHSSRAVL